MTPKTQLAIISKNAAIASEAKKGHVVKVHRKAREWNMKAHDAMKRNPRNKNPAINTGFSRRTANHPCPHKSVTGVSLKEEDANLPL
jgi:hypothetical protein